MVKWVGGYLLLQLSGGAILEHPLDNWGLLTFLGEFLARIEWKAYSPDKAMELLGIAKHSEQLTGRPLLFVREIVDYLGNVRVVFLVSGPRGLNVAHGAGGTELFVAYLSLRFRRCFAILGLSQPRPIKFLGSGFIHGIQPLFQPITRLLLGGDFWGFALAEGAEPTQRSCGRQRFQGQSH